MQVALPRSPFRTEELIPYLLGMPLAHSTQLLALSRISLAEEKAPHPQTCYPPRDSCTNDWACKDLKTWPMAQSGTALQGQL